MSRTRTTEPTLLEPHELARITGSDKPYVQRRWLRKNKWVFEPSGNGAPLVARAYMVRRLGGMPEPAERPKTKVNLENV